ncbi:hypothetical protein ACO0K9_06875 [Undibacterium sp. Ji50W]|uniref:hypothetical protein n=1 Tax=Undibacterium sp. Ji50W TaxID=3413041 RepID=UPI003BF11A94
MKTIISIWKQPYYARINTGSLKIIWFLLSLIVLLPMVVVFFVGKKDEGWIPILLALCLGLSMALGLLLLSWMLMLVPSVAMQYTPANARLVPQIKRNMQYALAIPTLLLPALLAVALNFQSQSNFFKIWMLGVFALLVYVATIRSKWVLILLVIMSQLPIWIGTKISLPDTGIWNQPVLMLLITVGLTALVLRWLFSIHGDQHFKREQNFAEMQKMMRGEEVPMNQYPLSFISPYDFLLRRCMKKVQRFPETVSQLIPFSMGRQVFWLTSFMSMLLMCVGMCVYFIFFLRHSGKFDDKDILLAYFVPVASFIFLPIVYSSVVLTSVNQRRGEQSLLCLAARLPGVKQQTVLIAGFLLRQALCLWFVTTVIVCLTVYFSSAGPTMNGSVWIGCFCLLPLSVMSLNNYAVMKSRYDFALLIGVAMSVLPGLVLVILYVKFLPCPAWFICAGVAVGTGIVLRWRWNQLMQVAAVFPVGRAV